MTINEAVTRVASIIEAHFKTLPAKKARKFRQDLHRLAIKCEKRSHA